MIALLRAARSEDDADQHTASTYNGFGFLVVRTGRESVFEFSRARPGSEVCLLGVEFIGAVNRFDGFGGGDRFDELGGGVEASVDAELPDEADGFVVGLPSLGRSIGAAKDLG